MRIVVSLEVIFHTISTGGGMPKPKILVIEDEASIQTALSIILKNEDYRVIVANNGVEGIALAEKGRPDLVILDLLMPKLDGQTMLHTLREQTWGKTIPVIIYTNIENSRSITETLQDGATHYLIKADTSAQDLLGTVKSIFNKG
jgi:DNA-binding response OmpR family regulator